MLTVRFDELTMPAGADIVRQEERVLPYFEEADFTAGAVAVALLQCSDSATVGG